MGGALESAFLIAVVLGDGCLTFIAVRMLRPSVGVNGGEWGNGVRKWVSGNGVSVEKSTEYRLSRFGGDDLAVFPRDQEQVPAFVLGAEFLGHGCGGGLAAEDSRGVALADGSGGFVLKLRGGEVEIAGGANGWLGECISLG